MTQPVPSQGVPDDATRSRADAEPVTPRLQAAPGEGELVARIRLGDADAFEALFHAYYEPLCAFALGYVLSREVAEDVVQETFVRLWERRTAWELRSSARSYLYSTVRNRAIMHLRHARIVARSQDRALRAPAGGGRTPAPTDEQVRMREMAEALARAIDRLPARRRQAYTLRWQHDLPLAEIAAVMGVSVKCVEAQLATASKAIREALADFF